MHPLEASQIVSKDIWFLSNSKNDIKQYVKFEIINNSIIFINQSNISKNSYIEVDKTICLQNITSVMNLNINQLAAIVFSVNNNKEQYMTVRNFLTTLKKDDPENYLECITSKRMQIFCSHLAHIRTNIPAHISKDSTQIPASIITDPLFEEVIKAWEKMHPHRKFSLQSIPSFDKGSGIFLSPLYLCFLMTFDKFCGNEIEKTQNILNGIRNDLEKFQMVNRLI
jgi:hypothetical protein